MARPAYLLCLCPDSSLLRDRLEALTVQYAAPWQRHVFWGDEGLTPAFWEHLTLQGLFETPKMLILREAQAIPVESLRQLSPFLVQLAGARPSLIWPILCLETAFERDRAKVPQHIQKLPFFLESAQISASGRVTRTDAPPVGWFSRVRVPS